MACRGGNHDEPRVTGGTSGTSSDGKRWQEIYYICDICDLTWSEYKEFD